MSGFLLTLGALSAGAHLATRDESAGLSGVFDLVSTPGTFGVVAGIANGILATVREKPMSLTANLVTAAVIGISEAVLAPDRDAAAKIGVLSGLGAAVGMAAFTRFSAGERALIENKAIPLVAA